MQRTADAVRSEDDTGASAMPARMARPRMTEPRPTSPDPSSSAPSQGSGGSPLRRIARAISSPWVSLVLLVIVFLHQAVGSAFYPVRQAFEVNEMEWFNGTASLVLWIAIGVCRFTDTVVR